MKSPIKYIGIAIAVVLVAWFVRSVKLQVQSHPFPSLPVIVEETVTGSPIATPTAEATEKFRKLQADKFSFVWFTGGWCNFHFGDGCHDSFITLINVEKKAEAVRKDGKKVTLYHYTGSDLLNDGGTGVLNSTEWLTDEEFTKKYIPFTKKRVDASFICQTDDVKNYKILMTIEDEDQQDTYVVENKDGFVEYLRGCLIVDQVKTFN